jgi:hypothetical protein
VAYGRVTGDWKADGDRKRKKSCDWSDTKVLAVPIALTLIVKMNCSAILDLYLAVVDDFNTWWVVVCLRVTGAWKADGDRKRKKSCDWSDSKVLAVPIALTLIVKMNCSANLALLCFG